jgi:hypothetical protein
MVMAVFEGCELLGMVSSGPDDPAGDDDEERSLRGA